MHRRPRRRQRARARLRPKRSKDSELGIRTAGWGPRSAGLFLYSQSHTARDERRAISSLNHPAQLHVVRRRLRTQNSSYGTFSNRTVPSNFGTATRWNGDVRTCAAIVSRLGRVSLYFTRSVPDSGCGLTISTPKPAVGRLPRKIPTTMFFVKSTSGILRSAACDFQSVANSAGARTVTCRGASRPLLGPLSTVFILVSVAAHSVSGCRATARTRSERTGPARDPSSELFPHSCSRRSCPQGHSTHVLLRS